LGAKSEVGIRELKVLPMLEQFMEQKFLPFVRATKASKPSTVRFYENVVQNLKAHSKLTKLRDEIKAGHFTSFLV
jgi:hypothetical protein